MKREETPRNMRENWLGKTPEGLCLDPESRICPAFDTVAAPLFLGAERSGAPAPLLDGFCEEHIQ